MVEVVAFDPRNDRARRLRRILGRSVGTALGDGVAQMVGFALVSWDERGQCTTSYYAASGPVGDNLMPSFVHDALQRHVTVRIAQETSTTQITGE